MSSRNRAVVVALLAGSLCACAGSAPSLPPDTTSVDRTRTLDLSSFSSSDAALSCEAIAAERQANAAAMQAANTRIVDDRVRDQVVTYFVPITGLALDGAHAGDRAEVQRLYARQDTLLQLGNVKKCAAKRTAANYAWAGKFGATRDMLDGR